MFAPLFIKRFTILSCPFSQTIKRGVKPSSVHLLTSASFLSKSSTVPSFPFLQAIMRGLVSSFLIRLVFAPFFKKALQFYHSRFHKLLREDWHHLSCIHQNKLHKWDLFRLQCISQCQPHC